MLSSHPEPKTSAPEAISPEPPVEFGVVSEPCAERLRRDKAARKRFWTAMRRIIWVYLQVCLGAGLGAALVGVGLDGNLSGVLFRFARGAGCAAAGGFLGCFLAMQGIAAAGVSAARKEETMRLLGMDAKIDFFPSNPGGEIAWCTWLCAAGLGSMCALTYDAAFKVALLIGSACGSLLPLAFVIGRSFRSRKSDSVPISD